MPTFWSLFAGFRPSSTLLARKQRHAAAGDDALLDRSLGRVHGVVDAVLALLDLDLGAAADTDHRDAAGELGQPLLQFLAVVIRGGLLDLRLDLVDAGDDVVLVTGAVDDRRVLLVDDAPAWRGRACRG